jgi:hypothetical protein
VRFAGRDVRTLAAILGAELTYYWFRKFLAN